MDDQVTVPKKYEVLHPLDILSNNSLNLFWSWILLRQNLIKWSLGHQDIVIPGEFVFHVTQYFTRNHRQKDKKRCVMGWEGSDRKEGPLSPKTRKTQNHKNVAWCW